MPEQSVFDAEARRLLEDAKREQNWKRWGPYLAERQWGTVREDYSEYGTCWDYFPHDHARAVSIAGGKMVSWGSPTANAVCALRWRSGMAGIRS